MPGPLVLPAAAAHSSPSETARADIRLLARCGALLGLILMPSLAQAGPAPALHNTVYGSIGYSTVRGSQDFHFVPVVDRNYGPPMPRFAPLHFGTTKHAPKQKPLIVGKVAALRGGVTVTRNGKTRRLKFQDPIEVGDTLSTDSTGSVRVLASTGYEFDEFGLSRNTKVTFDQQDYKDAHPAPLSPFMSLFQGASIWISNKIDHAHDNPNPNVETPVGSLGIRAMNRVPQALHPPIVADQTQTGGTVTTRITSSLPVRSSDGAMIQSAQASKSTINKGVFVQTHAGRGKAHDTWPTGDVEWVGYQMAGDKAAQVATPAGSTAIVGTQFIDRYDPKTHVMDVELISGSVSVKPKRSRSAQSFTAPVHIRCTAARATASPLTLKQYEATKAALFSP